MELPVKNWTRFAASFTAEMRDSGCRKLASSMMKLFLYRLKRRKKLLCITKDEGPRPGTTPEESLCKLKCCSGKEGGLVTAGNASGINDGAAAIVVMSEEKAKELGVKPMATFVCRRTWLDVILKSWVSARLLLTRKAMRDHRSYC